MKTLIIYDTTGYIILSQTGDYRVPEGVPYIEPDIPEGKYAVSVNVATGEPVLEDIPKTEDQQKIAALEAQQEATNQAVLGLMDMMMTN